MTLERATRGGESPVGERHEAPVRLFLSTAGHEKSRRKQPGPPGKAKYTWRPIVHKYREGTVKRTPVRGVKEKPETVRLQAVGALAQAGVTACLLEYEPASYVQWPG